jgi:hypothetical protein
MTHESQPVFKKGQHVLFKHWPTKQTNRSPIRVEAVTIRGWLHLEGHAGAFAPKLFVLADAPAERVPRNVLVAGDQEEVKP